MSSPDGFDKMDGWSLRWIADFIQRECKNAPASVDRDLRRISEQLDRLAPPAGAERERAILALGEYVLALLQQARTEGLEGVAVPWNTTVARAALAATGGET